jgi:hypothetical protein
MSHPLDGPRLKIRRAKEHIQTLNWDSQLFYGRQVGGATRGKLNKQTGLHRLTPAFGEVEYPAEWSVIIGEIAHDLRSALDQLVCHLAVKGDPSKKRNYGFCDRDVAGFGVGFPLFIYGPRAKRKKGDTKRIFNPAALNYLKQEFRAKIRAAQPYYRRNGGRMSPLWLLHQLNNTDKHRLIVVVGGYATRISVTGLSNIGGAFGLQIGVPPKSHAQAGAVGSEQVDVQIYPTYQIVFGGGCRAVEGLPVVPTLDRIADSVQSVIESFANDFPQSR